MAPHASPTAAASGAEGALRPVRALTIAVTRSCNLACTHCLVEAERGGRAHVPAATVARLVAELAALGGEAVCLTGGEPLRHPAWRSVAEADRVTQENAASAEEASSAASELSGQSQELAAMVATFSLGGPGAAAQAETRRPGRLAPASALAPVMPRRAVSAPRRLC